MRMIPAAALMLGLLTMASSALGFYYPPGHTPPGGPPNYNQIDSTLFLGAPILPVPPPDSGGFYIWLDAGKWTIASHIYSKGGSLEQFHGSILASMTAEPELGVNVFIDNFEIWSDTTSDKCLDENDRWGWVEWDTDLYEIWWDVTTKDTKPGGDTTDFLTVCIDGCAIDFNLWSSGHKSPFTLEQVFLGATMTKLSDVVGYTDTAGTFVPSLFSDTYTGISDPYQIQAGTEPDKDANITIFTAKALPGKSYNVLGEILLADSYPCDASYGSRYSGSFAYEGNGIQFSPICATVCLVEATCPDSLSLFVCDLSDICLEGFACAGSDSSTVIGGTLSGETVCFTPVVGSNTITLICYADCAVDTCETVIDITLNSAPVATCKADTSIFVCDLSEICIDGFGCTDEDDNLSSTTVTGGTLTGSTVCFTPVEGVNTITLICTDSCGAADTCETEITVTLNRAPVATCPGNSEVFVCDLSEICIGDFTCTDDDGNLASTEVIGGTLTGSTVCFTPVEGLNTITLICTDSCGAADTCETEITITLNSAPVASCPDNSEVFVCDLSEICIGDFTCTDDDGNLASTEVIGGTLTGSTVCFTPVEGINTITLICTDSCGAADTCETEITVTLNSAPVASCPADTNLTVCNLDEICLPGFGCTDADGNLASSSVSTGTLTDDIVCFTPIEGANVITLICIDSCGAADTCETTVNITLINPPVAMCPGDMDMFVCDLSEICIDGFSCTGGDASVIGGTLTEGTVCFTPVEGANVIQLICTNECGADTCEVTINVDLNAAPVASCPADMNLFVCDLSDICIDGFTCTDEDGNLASSSVTGGTLTGSEVCFTPVEGLNTITLICTDSCGAADTCVTNVTITLNSPPVAECPRDTSFFLCSLGDVCLSGFSATDVDGNLDSCWSSSGTFANGEICFTPVEGDNIITFYCVDSCGITSIDSCVVTVEIIVNSPPSASCPGDTTIDVCDLSEICLDGFVCSDVDGNLAPATVIGGTLNGTTVCFTPVEGENEITLICTDMCGAADTCVTVVTVRLTDPPVAMCPNDISMTVCDLSEICIDGFVCTGGSASVMGGTLNGTTVCFTPVEGDNIIKLICTNECGADTCMMTVTVNLYDPPTCPLVADQSIRLCDPIGQVCIDLGTSSIGDNGFACSVLSGPGFVSGDQWCYTPLTLSDTVTVVIGCSDNCGNVCRDTFTVAFYTDLSCELCPRVCIDTITAFSNSDVTICLKADAGSLPWGGFDFLLSYDMTMLSFVEAAPGQFLIDCEWEYFTYRVEQGVTGFIRLIAIADMNNSNQHPSCLAPDSGDELACLTFHTTNDRTLACLDALVQFYWNDCGDNSISNPLGDTLYIGASEAGSMVTWEGFDLTGDPGVGGPPLPCPSDKNEPLPCVQFCNGKIRIICPGEIDDRGDLNLNNVAYEIADAVLYSLYFINGPSSFAPSTMEAQIAASDINADGVPLTVADLVYLIRVITGDALPVPENLGNNGGPKIAASVGTVDVSVSSASRQLTVDAGSEHDIGAGLFIFRYENTEISDVSLLNRAADMNLSYSASAGELRVLIFNIEDRARIAAGSGDILEVTSLSGGSVELVSVDAATFAGGTLDADISAKRVLPSQFALNQNYPNPFNPSTLLSAEFPQASEYVFTIYNISGQNVRVLSGHSQAGALRVEWDGRNTDGVPVASGVYFYRLQAGDFESVRKMILMK